MTRDTITLLYRARGALPSHRPPRDVVRHRSRRHRLVRRLLPLLRACGRGSVPAAWAGSNKAAARTADLHAADVAAVAVSIAGEAGRRDRGRRRHRLDDRTTDRIRVRHPRARDRSLDLRIVVSRRLRGREDVRAARVPIRNRTPVGQRAMTVATAESLGVPEIFNAATHFVDRNIEEGRGRRIAIECGDASITYDEVHQKVNRFGSALLRLGVRPEERVLLLMYDGPEFVYAFFGAIKIGAVPVPLNTLWKPADYEYVIRDSRATMLVASGALLPQIEAIPLATRRLLRHIIVVGSADATHTHTNYSVVMSYGADDLVAEPTHRDAPAFWLYSSGSTGAPKGCVHLQHDMVVCARLFGQGILGIRPTDRTYSVAKLFFAYGLGNALYFPFSVGATTILWPGAPTPANVFPLIERHRPTLLFSVPTGYAMLMAYGKPEG